MIRQSRRTFVEQLDFRTSVGYGDGPGDRERFGLRGRGPTMVITDLGVMHPDPDTCELVLTHVHPGVDPADAVESTAWSLRIARDVARTEPPTEQELSALRRLQEGQ